MSLSFICVTSYLVAVEIVQPDRWLICAYLAVSTAFQLIQVNEAMRK